MASDAKVKHGSQAKIKFRALSGKQDETKSVNIKILH